jgi:N-acetylneuraminate synthase
MIFYCPVDHAERGEVLNNLPLIVFEIGINHNGRLDIAKELIYSCLEIGHRVEYPVENMFFKFQKRYPPDSTPDHMKNIMREHPETGEIMSYLDYKFSMELSLEDYNAIDGMMPHEYAWFVSVWDIASVDWVRAYFPDMAFIKIPSPHLTNHELIKAAKDTGIGIILSTGMSTERELIKALGLFDRHHVITVLACTSTYPCSDEEINLAKMDTIQKWTKQGFDKAFIGFSSHSPGVFPPILAAAYNADMIEFHVTLDRAMKGSDHSASIEPKGVEIILRDIKRIPTLIGDGVIGLTESEKAKKEALRG